jgi:citrate synthase
VGEGGEVVTAAWLSAAEASELLGVKRATLYAYASRGKVRTQPAGRSRRYLRADLERLRARQQARSGHGPVAAGALRWGEPVLDTRITEIRSDGPWYRGRAAVDLAETSSFEETAELLWGERDPARSLPWPGVTWPVAPERVAALLSSEARPVDVLAAVVPLLAQRDPQRLHRDATASLQVTRRLVRLLSAALALPRDPARAVRALGEPSIVESLMTAFGVAARPAVAAALTSALVLCADHGLNPSSFAARVAASAGADVHACVTGALATLSGPRHGGMPARVASLFDEIGRASRTARVVAQRLERGDVIPGFGHPLYPEGDPRAEPLLRAARRAAPRSRTAAIAEALVETMKLAGGQRPTVDLGLAVLEAALGLPRGAATALFAIGRTAGWVAQTLEQREAGFVLRPRARYVG